MNFRFTSLLVALSGLAMMASAVAQENAPPPPQTEVVVAKAQTVVVTDNLPARLEASREAVIQAQVGGIVQKRFFEEGAAVRAGEQLYQIDDAVYQANLLSAKATLAQAEAGKALAQSTANRYAPLVKEKAVSRQTYDQALAEVKVAEANIMAAQAAVRQAEINLGHTRVTAPIAGFIGQSKVSEGSLVSPGTVEMARIRQLDPMYVNITQSAADVMKIKQAFAAGQLDGVDLKVNITLEDGTPYAHAGRLLFAEQTVDAATGELLVRAEVPNPDQVLLPGLYVRADIPQHQYKNAFLVPQNAVTRGKTDTLRVVGKDGAFAAREVKIARAFQDQWIVTDGLKNGEWVMVDTLSQFMAGVTHVTPMLRAADGQLAPAQ